jgi:hypothetical protein
MDELEDLALYMAPAGVRELIESSVSAAIDRRFR